MILRLTSLILVVGLGYKMDVNRIQVDLSGPLSDFSGITSTSSSATCHVVKVRHATRHLTHSHSPWYSPFNYIHSHTYIKAIMWIFVSTAHPDQFGEREWRRVMGKALVSGETRLTDSNGLWTSSLLSVCPPFSSYIAWKLTRRIDQ